MSSDEHYLPGGLYDPQQECRTDFYLREHGKPMPGFSDPSRGGKIFLDLHIVTGNADLCIVEITAEDVRRLAEFLKDVSLEVQEKNEQLRLEGL